MVARARHFDCADFDDDDARRAHAWIKTAHDAQVGELTQARASLAWKFTAQPAAVILRRVRAELRADARRLRAEIAALTDDAAFATPAPRPATLDQLSLFE